MKSTTDRHFKAPFSARPRYRQLGSAPSSTSDRLRRRPNPPPAGRLKVLEWRGAYRRWAHMTHLSPALNRTPCKNE
jgi:hypothetical protein